MNDTFADHDEWLESDGLGGFAMGSADLVPRRRYHALLITAQTPPTNRMVLANGVEVWAERSGQKVALSSFLFAPNVRHPAPNGQLKSFSSELWPTWIFNAPGGGSIQFEIFMPRGSPLVCLQWSALDGARDIQLRVRPLLSVRDYHALHRCNEECNLATSRHGQKLQWSPYRGAPSICGWSNGSFAEDRQWYRDFVYSIDCARGFESTEDLWSPGVLQFSLGSEPAVLVFGAASASIDEKAPIAKTVAMLAKKEATRRKRFSSTTARAADHFIVTRGSGMSIVAGYPWFSDWGRDTFVSLRGLCLATGRYDDAMRILRTWAEALSRGMIPNRFPEHGEAPEYNSVDAALWFVVASYELLKAARRSFSSREISEILAAIEVILQNYSQGSRYRIAADSDGLLSAGEPGVQLTWMDAKIGDYVVTPRTGKPVEVQALWLNALRIGSELLVNSSERWQSCFQLGLKSFSERFWNPSRQCLYDVIDVDHRFGAVDPRVRPNQVFAIGGLPFPVIDDQRGTKVLEAIEKSLLTPMGLRSLAPGERGYAARYEGAPEKRDFAYHMGTTWVWLMGAFIDAWLRLHGGNKRAKRDATERFLAPLLYTAPMSRMGQLPEIADAEPPYTARGCPFQAWSVAELLRAQALLA